MPPSFFITTPIYYVNDRPHLGHLYTTTMADIIARRRRLNGDDLFFLTGTDEHAAKVAEAAAQHGMAPLAWADENAAIFEQTVAEFGISNDDFIRTTQPRHTERVQAYIAGLLRSGDVYRGRYEGWYDAGQEEYVPEARAAALDFRSPVTGRPLVRKAEENYFFRLSAYQEELLRLLDERPEFVQPEARRNEVIGRLREGLHDVPISRTDTDWGISIPGDEAHRVYVWIDALFNYVSAVDTPERRRFWPADVHFIAKDILWFHAVIWPALLLALHRTEEFAWLELPRRIYAHSFWVSDGQKMSKSLGNFVDLARLRSLAGLTGLDGLRYFLAAAGPLGVADSNFSEERLFEVYTAELANGFGNLVQRVTKLIERHAGGRTPEPGAGGEPERRLCAEAGALNERVAEAFERLAVDEALAQVREFVGAANRYAEETAPWQRAAAGGAATALYHLAAAARLAAWHLWPVIPATAAEASMRLGGRAVVPGLSSLSALRPGDPVVAGQPLFPRVVAGVTAHNLG